MTTPHDTTLNSDSTAPEQSDRSITWTTCETANATTAFGQALADADHATNKRYIEAAFQFAYNEEVFRQYDLRDPTGDDPVDEHLVHRAVCHILDEGDVIESARALKAAERERQRPFIRRAYRVAHASIEADA